MKVGTDISVLAEPGVQIPPSWPSIWHLLI